MQQPYGQYGNSDDDTTGTQLLRDLIYDESRYISFLSTGAGLVLAFFLGVKFSGVGYQVTKRQRKENALRVPSALSANEEERKGMSRGGVSSRPISLRANFAYVVAL